MNRKIIVSIIIALGFISLLVFGTSKILTSSSTDKNLAERQSYIHHMGSHVMPFDLNLTTHVFKKDKTGGIEQVVAKNDDGLSQVPMIQMHLSMERDMFARGDFSDPSSLHGSDMPGLKEISAGANKIEFIYSDLSNGAQIQYKTTDQNLINYIHQWFDAQIQDHGSDATN